MMMEFGCTDLGKGIRMLRTMRGMSRIELSEAAGISESHLKKIESGTRQPGINTYRKIMEVLGAGIVAVDKRRTVQTDCAEKVRKILMGSTEGQAVFMTSILESMARNMDALAQQ